MKRIFSAALSLFLATSCLVLPTLAAQASDDQPPLLIAPAPTQTEPSTPLNSTAVETPTIDEEPSTIDEETSTIDETASTDPNPLPFSDLRGHWAEKTLRKAVTDGHIKGYADGTLRPDAAITKAELVSILSRVIPTQGQETSAEKASRADAFVLLDRAFLLSVGQPSGTLAAYTDASCLAATERLAASALLSCGALGGYADGTLRPKNTISRAEFLSLLYRVAPQRAVVDTLPAVQTAPLLLSVKEGLQNLGFDGMLYLQTEDKETTLANVSAARVVLYAKKSERLTLTKGTKIKTLIVADGAQLSLKAEVGSSVDTVILLANQITLSLAGQISRVEVLGDTNTIHVDSALDSILVSGPCNEIKGSGSVKTASVLMYDNTLSLAAEKTEEVSDEGIKDAQITLSAPASLPVDSLLTITATVKNPRTRDCRAVWLVGDTVVKEESLTVSPDGGSAQYLARFEYKQNMNTDFKVRFELRYYDTQEGEAQLLSAEGYTKLENHPDEYYDQYTPDKVLSLVQTGYQGDNTLAWAQSNDYDVRTKEIWVNTKNYGSKSQYLVWINIAKQHVNVFEGGKGQWSLIQNYIVGSGRSGRDTPVGVYTIGTRSAAGWTTDTYNVRPVLRFKMGSGLAFHSRIYDPDYTYITNPSIGYPISHGCIRMYDKDIGWMYDHIPAGTTVVVY